MYTLASVSKQLPCSVCAVKNVAAEIADKLCQSVATKLEGRVLGTFNSKYMCTFVSTLAISGI